ncbi:MAG: hypothetical protein GY796_20665, partial [Chloroflexi bacterium]|nr:hypothetical protein [Chloroflexota bacterium]
MLSDLNKVNWNNLSHAYGEAADVPALLLGLASEAPDTRQKALILLYRNIWHEGVVFEATAYAVPFLRQLLEHPEVQDKGKILILLAHLATGNAYLDVFPSDETAETLSETTYKARLAMERSWVQATNDAVQKGTPTYVRLLEDRDPIVRMCAAYLLACFQTINRKIVPVLLQIIENEVQQQAKASMMLALGVLAKNRPAYIECLHRFRGPAHPLLVRVAATMAIARNQRTAAPDDALELLVDALSAPGAELHTA